ncbi:hypothetical protein GCM10020000_32170 [Streptomyces olivoverticillatus]
MRGAAPRRIGLRARSAGGGERVRRGQVDEAHRNVVRQGPADGGPFRREGGEGPERGAARVVGGMGEEGDGRAHALVGREVHDRVRLGRPLDEDRARGALPEGGHHGPCRARPVVAHAQQGRPAHTDTSRQAR